MISSVARLHWWQSIRIESQKLVESTKSHSTGIPGSWGDQFFAIKFLKWILATCLTAISQFPSTMICNNLTRCCGVYWNCKTTQENKRHDEASTFYKRKTLYKALVYNFGSRSTWFALKLPSDCYLSPGLDLRGQRKGSKKAKEKTLESSSTPITFFFNCPAILSPF